MLQLYLWPLQSCQQDGSRPGVAITPGKSIQSSMTILAVQEADVVCAQHNNCTSQQPLCLLILTAAATTVLTHFPDDEAQPLTQQHQHQQQQQHEQQHQQHMQQRRQLHGVGQQHCASSKAHLLGENWSIPLGWCGRGLFCGGLLGCSFSQLCLPSGLRQDCCCCCDHLLHLHQDSTNQSDTLLAATCVTVTAQAVTALGWRTAAPMQLKVYIQLPVKTQRYLRA